MTSCKHSSLILLPEKGCRVRCCNCYLTIESSELDDGFCPECFENHGEKRYDFEGVKSEPVERARYQCEECGVIIDCD